MTNKELIEIASNYMQIWSTGKESLLDKYAHNDLIVNYTHFAKPYRSISDYKEMLGMTYEYSLI